MWAFPASKSFCPVQEVSSPVVAWTVPDANKKRSDCILWWQEFRNTNKRECSWLHHHLNLTKTNTVEMAKRTMQHLRVLVLLQHLIVLHVTSMMMNQQWSIAFSMLMDWRWWQAWQILGGGGDSLCINTTLKKKMPLVWSFADDI